MKKPTQKQQRSEREVTEELTRIKEAWNVLKDMDDPARDRALDWLRHWSNYEANNGDYC